MGDLLITAGTAVLLLAAGRLGRQRVDLGLAILALASLGVYTDSFDFHGGGVFVHHHDAGHYYLGARYFAELGYGDLYVAMLAAEVEAEGGTRLSRARDLHTNRDAAIAEIEQRIPEVRARFTPERWLDFRRDADFLRRAMGLHYSRFLQDHGFNPTPVWALIGSFFAERVTPGDAIGLLFLCLLDPILVVLALVWVAIAFGRRAALLGLIFFTTAYGADFDWVGGAFLRQLWLVALISTACCLETRRHATAGCLLALAATLRVFPVIFALGIGVQAAWILVKRRTLDPGHRRFFAAFAGTGALLVAATGLGAHGFAAWQLFAANLEAYVGLRSLNQLGFGKVLEALGGVLASAGISWLEGVLALGMALVVVLVVVRLAPRGDAPSALALGCLVLYGTLPVAAYYYVFLLLAVFVHRDRPHVLALLFTIEAVTWGLHVAGAPGTVPYIVQSLLWLLFFGALYVDDIFDTWTEAPPARQAIRGEFQCSSATSDSPVACYVDIPPSRPSRS